MVSLKKLLLLVTPMLLLSACSKHPSKKPAADGPEVVIARPELDFILQPMSLEPPVDKIVSDRQMKATKSVNATYYFLLGHWLSDRGENTNAIVAFERVRTLDEGSSDVHLRLGKEYVKQSALKQGVAALRKSIELDRDNREAKLYLANLHAQAKKYSEATVLLNEILAKNPDDEMANLNLALNEIDQQNPVRAQEILSKYLQRNPESATAYFYLGRIEQDRGHLKEAIHAFERAIDLRSGFVQAGTYLAFLQEETGNIEAALETYNWLAAQTDAAVYHKKLGQMYLDHNDYEHALTSMLNLERVEATDVGNRVKVGLIQMELKLYADAQKRFEQLVKENADSEFLRYYLGNALEKQGHAKAAIKQYEKVPETSKIFPDALMRRVMLLKEQSGGVKEAWKLLQGYIVKSDSEELFEVAVHFLDESDRRDEAMLLLEQAKTRFGDSERMLYLEGSLFEKMGRFPEAIQSMLKILAKNPTHAAALNFVGYMWADQGIRLKDAESKIRQAMALKPKDPFIVDSLGWVLFKQGRKAESLKTLQAAFTLRPDESIIAQHLGDVLTSMGRFDEAVNYYEIALKLGPSKEKDREYIEAKISARRSTSTRESCRVTDERCHLGSLLVDPTEGQRRSPASTGSP